MTIILILLGVVLLIRLFLIYDPKIDIVTVGNKHIVYLWYNKYTFGGEFEKRKPIKLFEI